MYQDINNPALLALMGAAAIVAYIFLSTGLKALAKRSSHFDILSPVFDSCLNCTGARVIPPEKVPTGHALHGLNKTVAECRELLRDEVRYPDEKLQDIWGFYYEAKTEDYTELAAKCPRFQPRLVQKDGSIG